MTIRRRIALLMLAATVPCLAAEPPELAGPYKLVARDFTGNGQRDLAIGFHDLGLLSLAEGNGRGLFQHRAITPLLASDNNEPIKRSYNLSAGDLDGDHRPDLAVGCEGVTSHLVLVVKNQGDGSFVVKNQFPTQSGAKGVALAELARLPVFASGRAGAPSSLVTAQGDDGYGESGEVVVNASRPDAGAVDRFFPVLGTHDWKRFNASAPSGLPYFQYFNFLRDDFSVFFKPERIEMAVCFMLLWLDYALDFCY